MSLIRYGLITGFALFLFTGCGGSGGHSCGTPSDELRSARTQWHDAVNDGRHCNVDDDCAISGLSASNTCFANCGVAVNADEVQVLSELTLDLQTRIDECGGGPCPVPTCPPGNPEARCIDNRCELIRTTPSPAPS